MNKRICVLLSNSIENDARVIKTIQTLAVKLNVDLYYINGQSKDSVHFNDNVRLFNFPYKTNLLTKIISHSLFTREYLFLMGEVLKGKVEYDIVWANDLTTLLPAYKIAKKLKAKLVYDSHEIYIETLNQFFPRHPSLLKKPIFSTLLRIMKINGKFIEKKYIPNCDLFITVNQSILEYFRVKHSIKKGITIVNYPHNLNQLEKKTPLIPDTSKDSTIFLYQGALNEGRGLRLLIETFKTMPNSIKLVILGDGPLKEELLIQSKENLNINIYFIPKVSLNALPNYTRSAHVGINLLEDFNLSKKMASPNKLYEYIHAGIPVICSLGLENNRVLNEFNVGKSTILEKEALSKVILKMAEDSDVGQYKEELARAKKVFCWENQELKLTEALSTL